MNLLSMRMRVQFLASFSGLKIQCFMSCAISRRCRLDPELLWVGHMPAAAVPIRPLAWELPYATHVALKGKKKKTKKTKKAYIYLYRYIYTHTHYICTHTNYVYTLYIHIIYVPTHTHTHTHIFQIPNRTGIRDW